MEFNKFVEKYFDPKDESGFSEVIFQRQAKIKSLKIRLKKYYLTDKEIDQLVDIIVKAEIQMEEIKRKFKPENYKAQDLVDFEKQIIDIQKKMKEDFDKKLSKMLKDKYEKAKKLKEKLDKEDAKKKQ